MFLLNGVWEVVPLKQGLKLESGLWVVGREDVWEVVPLKQGLKHPYPIDFLYGPFQVWEVVPLKQGLKLKNCWTCRFNMSSLRGSSIKTRIDTSVLEKVNSCLLQCLRGSSIKTRIETRAFPGYRGGNVSLRGSSIKTRIETSSLTRRNSSTLRFER